MFFHRRTAASTAGTIAGKSFIIGETVYIEYPLGGMNQLNTTLKYLVYEATI